MGFLDYNSEIAMEIEMEQIRSCEQKGTVKDYCDSFLFLFDQVRNNEEMTDLYAIYLFICGLEPRIRNIFVKWHQYSCLKVEDVISLALKLDANDLQDSFSPFDPKSSFYIKDLVFDINMTLDELLKDNEFFRNGKFQEISNEDRMFGKSAYNVCDEMPERIRDGMEIQISDKSESELDNGIKGSFDCVPVHVPCVGSIETKVLNCSWINKWDQISYEAIKSVVCGSFATMNENFNNLDNYIRATQEEERHQRLNRVIQLDDRGHMWRDTGWEIKTQKAMVYMWHKWKNKLDDNSKFSSLPSNQVSVKIDNKVDFNHEKLLFECVHGLLNLLWICYIGYKNGDDCKLCQVDLCSNKKGGGCASVINVSGIRCLKEFGGVVQGIDDGFPPIHQNQSIEGVFVTGIDTNILNGLVRLSGMDVIKSRLLIKFNASLGIFIFKYPRRHYDMHAPKCCYSQQVTFWSVFYCYETCLSQRLSSDKVFMVEVKGNAYYIAINPSKAGAELDTCFIEVLDVHLLKIFEVRNSGKLDIWSRIMCFNQVFEDAKEGQRDKGSHSYRVGYLHKSTNDRDVKSKYVWGLRCQYYFWNIGSQMSYTLPLISGNMIHAEVSGCHHKSKFKFLQKITSHSLENRCRLNWIGQCKFSDQVVGRSINNWYCFGIATDRNFNKTRLWCGLQHGNPLVYWWRKWKFKVHFMHLFMSFPFDEVSVKMSVALSWGDARHIFLCIFLCHFRLKKVTTSANHFLQIQKKRILRLIQWKDTPLIDVAGKMRDTFFGAKNVTPLPTVTLGTEFNELQPAWVYRCKVTRIRRWLVKWKWKRMLKGLLIMTISLFRKLLKAGYIFQFMVDIDPSGFGLYPYIEIHSANECSLLAFYYPDTFAYHICHSYGSRRISRLHNYDKGGLKAANFKHKEEIKAAFFYISCLMEVPLLISLFCFQNRFLRSRISYGGSIVMVQIVRGSNCSCCN